MSAARGVRPTARAGSAALEFALVGSLALALAIMVIQLGFRLYAQTALDQATQIAGRALQTGSARDYTTTARNFQVNVFCDALGRLLNCDDVALSLRPVANYLTASGIEPPLSNGQLDRTALTFDPGQGSSLMLLQAVYVTPGLSWPLSSQPILSAAAFRNEY